LISHKGELDSMFKENSEEIQTKQVSDWQREYKGQHEH